MVSSPPQDETAGMEKMNRLTASREESNLWGARPEQTLPSLRGLESQKISGGRRSFFLDFPFYRTSQELLDVTAAGAFATHTGLLMEGLGIFLLVYPHDRQEYTFRCFRSSSGCGGRGQ
jgi:hypothetical protein